MKKQTFIVFALVLAIISALMMFKVLHLTPISEINAKQFSSSFNVISGNATIEDLSRFT